MDNRRDQIEKTIDLPGGQRRVVLYVAPISKTSSRASQNLACIDADGNRLWTAKTPDSANDCFCEISFDGGILRAWSWSGYVLTLDVETGERVAIEFTK